MKTPIMINKKEYFIKDNLNKYLQDNIIIDIIIILNFILLNTKFIYIIK